MKVNQDTSLFEEISSEEREQMLTWVKTVVMRGKLPSPDPAWLNQWMEELNYYGSKKMIALYNEFPQKVMLSLLLANN